MKHIHSSRGLAVVYLLLRWEGGVLGRWMAIRGKRERWETSPYHYFQRFMEEIEFLDRRIN